MSHSLAAPAGTPGLWPRFASLLYEGILLFGVLFITAYLYSALLQFRSAAGSPLGYVFQIYAFAVSGLYFVWCWTHGGQTLPMKTWKIRLVATAGKLTPARAWLRYTMSWIGPVMGCVVYKLIIQLNGFGTASFSMAAFWMALPFLLLNWLWIYADSDRQLLHDRLAGTRLVTVTASPVAGPA
jgi:uncharacterized RDD family membrane protein YckC